MPKTLDVHLVEFSRRYQQRKLADSGSFSDERVTQIMAAYYDAAEKIAAHPATTLPLLAGKAEAVLQLLSENDVSDDPACLVAMSRSFALDCMRLVSIAIDQPAAR